MAVYTLFGQGAAGAFQTDSSGYTMGTMFSLSQAASLTGIWFYSASSATVLPGECLVYAVNGNGTGTIVTGTNNTSPSWSGAVGSGWVKCSYSGVSLAASTNYKVCVFYAGGNNWYSATNHYWDTGTGSGGITSGIITAPNQSTAQTNDGGGGTFGQSTFHTAATLTYPDTIFQSTNYWIDVEVTTPSVQPVLYQMRSMP